MTPPVDPPEAAEPSELIRRFTAAERWIHRTTAALVGTALVTAAFLYLPAPAGLVGRRALLVTVHEWAGIAMPVPLLAGLVSRAFRADLVRLNRFGPHDRGWMRATLRRHSPPAGKSNAGQKLYAAVIAGTALVMIATGLIMWFPRLTPLFPRTGATFVHGWPALLIGAGLVPRSWARRHHPLWESERHSDHQFREESR